MGKDKDMIWDDCAQCAYKHLAAAYAEMTQRGCACSWMDSESVLAARAVIALSEVEAGYKGNIDIAVGCLAAAETRAEPCHASMYRQVRLYLQAGRVEEAIDGLVRPTTGWVEAHITEAVRELAEVSEGDFDLENMNYEETLEWLKQKLKYLRETFEIGKVVTNEHTT